MRNCLPVLAVLFLFGLGSAQDTSLDCVLRGGRIIDGTGNPWYFADLGISGDRISRISKPGSLQAKEIIDVNGLYVAPGFIDMLGQSETYVLINPHVKSKITQGITTEFTGEGASPAPNNDWIIHEAIPSLEPYGIVMDWQTWDQYFDRINKNRSAVNFAFMVGATQVRQFVMKNEMRAPSGSELAQMQEQVRTAMKSGVFGVSTSLLYAPASYSKTDEIIALAKIASEYGGFYASHIRNEADRLMEALDEAIEIGRKANCPVEVWHIKVSGKQNFGKMKDALQKITDARAQGIDITADMYPYPAGATALAASLPKWALEGGTDAMLKRLADSATREKIKKEMKSTFPETDNIFMDADSGKRIMIASAQNAALKKYVGKMLEEIARDHGADEPETLCWFVEQDQGATGAIYFTQSEEELQKAMKAPFVAFNCDYPGMATDGILGNDHPHPRAYGTFPRVLARYVREKNLLTLEEAIRKMTSLPAQRLGLQRRGILKEGNFADITVFDFNRVRDVATFEDPNHYSEGMIYVFVNGRPVLAKGAFTENLPGRILLRGQNN